LYKTKNYANLDDNKINGNFRGNRATVADDFLLDLAQQTTAQGLSEPQWHSCFSRSEVITTLIAYHHSGRKCFKYFYCQDVRQTYKSGRRAAGFLMPLAMNALWP
jgi:hypothetical protein